jgi:hypothetical protein
MAEEKIPQAGKEKRFVQVFLRELSFLEQEVKEMYKKEPTEEEVYSLYDKILSLGTKRAGGLTFTYSKENPKKVNFSADMYSTDNKRTLLEGIAHLVKVKDLEKVKNLKLPILEKPANIYLSWHEVIANIKDEIRKTNKKESKEEPTTSTEPEQSDGKPMTAQERKVYEKEKKEKEKKKVKYGPNYIEELSQDKYETLQKLIVQRKQIEEDFQKEIQSLNKVMVSANTSLDFSSLKIDLVYDTPKKIREILLDKEIIDREQQNQVRDLYPAMIKYQQYMKELKKDQEEYAKTAKEASNKLLEELKAGFGQMMVEDKKGEEEE